MGGYIGKGKSVVNVESYTKTQANATFLTPTGDGSQLTGISGSATDIVAFSTDPAVGAAGKIYYNTTTKVLRTSDGTSWTNVSNAAPQPSGGTIALTSTNEGEAFSYDLGTDFTDDREGDTALTYALASGTLPSGLSVPSAGSSTLAGTLGDVSGNTVYAFAITATDADGLTSSPQSYTMTVIDLPFSATGGTIVTSGGYKYHTFTASSSFISTGVAPALEYLIVAGGAGAGGGGGGAGGLLSATISAGTSANTYSIVVGAGGGGASAASYGGQGSNSSALSVTSLGGGAGSQRGNNGSSGGSGGGSGQDNTSSGGAGTSGQGFAGGAGRATPYGAAGGGGGAGEVGNGGGAHAPGRGDPADGGYGGDGVNTYSAWATATSTGDSGFYAGGGGGGNNTSGGITSITPLGGAGGGGNGARSNGGTGNSGTANTGGGGGGGEYDGAGGSGGSGIVIIRYAV